MDGVSKSSSLPILGPSILLLNGADLVSPYLSQKLLPTSAIDAVPYRETLLIDIWRLILNFLQPSNSDKRELSLLCRLFRDSVENLTSMWKNMALHPIHPPSDMVNFARIRKESNKERWTRAVARSFGPALKAAKHCSLLQSCFVEAVHPRWKRLRCARIVLTQEDISMALPVGDDLRSVDPKMLTPSQAAPIYEKISESIRGVGGEESKRGEEGGGGGGEEGGEGEHDKHTRHLDLQFYDGEFHAQVDIKDMTQVPFSSVALLEAANGSNYLRLLQLMRGAAKLLSPDSLRIGCSLIISQTVGNTEAREKLCAIGCASVIVTTMHNQRYWSNGNLMESLARVCMNLACSDLGINDFVKNDGIQLFLNLIKQVACLRNHSGYVYAALKTLHNVAILHDHHRRTMIRCGVMDIITNAESNHSDVSNLVVWCRRAREAIRRFDGPTMSYASVLAEMSVVVADDLMAAEMSVVVEEEGEEDEGGDGSSHAGFAINHSEMAEQMEEWMQMQMQMQTGEEEAEAKAEVDAEWMQFNSNVAWGDGGGEEVDYFNSLDEDYTLPPLVYAPSAEDGYSSGDSTDDFPEEDWMPPEINAVMSPGGSILVYEDNVDENSGEDNEIDHLNLME